MSRNKEKHPGKTKKPKKARRLNKRVSASIHTLFNLTLVALIYMMSVHWELGWLAIALVFLSKWRVVAVRFRFWWANIRTNLPDIIVGISTVAWLVTNNDSIAQILITMFYAGWLIFLKPRDDQLSMILQAGWSTFIGINTAMVLGYMQLDILVLFLVWIIIWSNTRHFLGVFDDDSVPLLAVVWATLAVQIAWLCLQWVVLFSLPGDIMISQYALIIVIINYGLSGWYRATRESRLDVKHLILRYGLFCLIAICLVLALSPWKGVI